MHARTYSLTFQVNKRQVMLDAEAANWMTPHGMGNLDNRGKRGGAGGGAALLRGGRARGGDPLRAAHLSALARPPAAH